MTDPSEPDDVADQNAIRRVEWRFGQFAVHARGAMLAETSLRAPSGQQVRPFYEAPWIGEPGPVEPPLLAGMRNEFPCLPFGGLYPDDSVTDAWAPSLVAQVAEADAPIVNSDLMLHGPCGAADWTFGESDAGGVTLTLDYPGDSPIARLERTVCAVPDAPAIDFTLSVTARRPCRRPIGVHPNLALPAVAGALELQPGAFAFGMVHPAGPEPGVSRALSGAVFEDLSRVPLHSGGAAGFNRLPFAHDTEETLQLCGCDGTVAIVDHERRCRYRLDWDAAILPSLLLWISNRGRAYAPWNGRNLCVGVEPMAGAFDLGTRAALASNPINARGLPTALPLTPGAPVTLRYRFALVDG